MTQRLNLEYCNLLKFIILSVPHTATRCHAQAMLTVPMPAHMSLISPHLPHHHRLDPSRSPCFSHGLLISSMPPIHLPRSTRTSKSASARASSTRRGIALEVHYEALQTFGEHRCVARISPNEFSFFSFTSWRRKATSVLSRGALTVLVVGELRATVHRYKDVQAIDAPYRRTHWKILFSHIWSGTVKNMSSSIEDSG